MKRILFFAGTALISLVLLAGCQKEMTSTDTTTTAEPGASDQVAGIDGTDGGVGFDIADGDSSAADGSQATGDEVVDPLSLRVIYFGYDESVVNEEAQMIIRAHAEVLAVNPDVNLQISGHADERGTREYNLALGDQRAEAVSSYFQQYGVDASRISVVSYGEEIPAVMGSDEDAWGKNRRAEFDY